MGYSTDEMTGRGFRAMARTNLDEVLGIRADIIEHQLAHKAQMLRARHPNALSSSTKPSAHGTPILD